MFSFIKNIHIKIFVLAIILNIFTISASSTATIAPDGLTAQKIYEYAENRDGKSMAAVREYIDIKDDNGNTALCLAQQNKDKEAFRMLLVFGASKDVECYDETDTVCAIIVGEKLKVNGAGWLLGAAATAGAIYGAKELLDNRECPSGYSVKYQSVNDCGIHPEGWIYDYKGRDEKHKKCGRCTPKTYDTGCTTLWQSVNDCGEHPEGWLFESSGYSGDEVCGICTPKQCNLRDDVTHRGEDIRYTDIKYCPHRDFMRPSSQEQTGWAGVHGCYICTYVCDENTGFGLSTSCEKNAQGHVAYHCQQNAETGCFYRSSPITCPITDTISTKGAKTAYSSKENCPYRKYMVADNVTPRGWSGEDECYDCNYKCDEESGFEQTTTCQTNVSGGVGYICETDTATNCHFRKEEVTCTVVDTPTTKGASTAYTTKNKCPDRKYMVVENVSPNGWAGEAQCYNCNYKCDEENGFASEVSCKNNTSDGIGYICEIDTATNCYYHKQEKSCPVVDTQTTKGASISYSSKDRCPYRRYMVAETVTPNGWAGEAQCYNCNYKCDEENGFSSLASCKNNTSGEEGYLCQMDPSTGCYYRSSTPTPDTPVAPEKLCPDDYDTAYQSVSNCMIIGGTESGWSYTFSGYSGELKCGKCTAKPCTEGKVSTELTDLSQCATVTYKKPISFELKGYSGKNACYSCIYACDNAQNAFDSASACSLAPDFGCTEVNGCWIIEDGCPEGSSTRYQSVSDCGSSGSYGWSFTFNGSHRGHNGKRCGICTPKTCPTEPENTAQCAATASGTPHPEGWEIINSSTSYAGNTPCKVCNPKNCAYGETSCYAGSYETVTSTENGYYSGNHACYSCDYTCWNSYSSLEACEAAASSSQYCKSATYNITCWYLETYNCPYGYTAGQKVEDCDTYKNGGYIEQTIVVPDSEHSKGIDAGGNVADCLKCGFNCTGQHDGWDLVNNKDAKGWKYIEIWSSPKCYLKVLPGEGSYGQCIDDSGVIDTAYPLSYIHGMCPEIQGSGTLESWIETELAGFFYGDEQCYLCTASPCSRQIPGTDTQCNQTGFEQGALEPSITSGNAACYICDCKQSDGYYENEADVPSCAGTIKSVSNYGNKKCYYCSAGLARMTMFNDVINNQTLIVEHTEGDYAGNITVNAQATLPVVDELTGETIGGDATASITVYNSAANANVAVQSAATSVYNAQALGEEDAEHISATATNRLIMQEGAENTTGTGMQSYRTDVYNAYAKGNATATGVIDIEDTKAATNVIYGIDARRNAYNAYANGELAKAFGTVNIKTATNSQAYGIHAGQNIYNPENSAVNVTGTGSGDMYGLYSEEGSVYNSGDVNVHAHNGNAYGIYVNNGDGQIVDNSGNIIVASDTKTAYGIYVENAGQGMAITNTGTIIATGDDTSRGIKILENGSNVHIDNQGKIWVNGALNSEYSAIDLGGGSLTNRGEMIFEGDEDLDTLNGKVNVAQGGSYQANSLKGGLNIDKSLVKGNFDDTYTIENAVVANDIDGLSVTSQSAMFTGSLKQNGENSYDAVATRRQFAEFTPNDSMANYLEQNYKLRRLLDFYDDLKDIETEQEIQKQLLRRTGADTLINMPQENLAALRNAYETIADSVLDPTDEENRIISGADTLINETDGRRGASGYDTTAATAFMYGDKRLDNKNRLGLGLSYTQLSTSYDNGGNHKENFVNLFIPWLHKITEKLRIVSVLNLGYGNGKYERTSDDDAHINDFIYGLTNKLAYSINLADYAEFEPALVVNAIGYTADSMKTDELSIKGDTHLSVEAGIGGYLKKELLHAKYGTLTARLGGMFYHELADPYNRIRAGFRGGVGSFELNDFANIYSRDRAVLSAMLDYEYKRLALYIRYHQLIQRNKAKNFDMGVRYNF